ncbi:hypothetical protein Tco_0293086, partial [Tanacetum coccineum]
IDKFKTQMIEGKFLLVDDDGKPLPKVDSSYGTNILLEQWMETKWDDDYDPYNDYLYNSHDMSNNLEAIVMSLISRFVVRRRNRFILMFVESIVI